MYCFNSKGFVLHYYISSHENRKGRTIRKLIGGGGGGRRGTKKIFALGKIK